LGTVETSGGSYVCVLTGWGGRVVGSDWLSVASVGWLLGVEFCTYRIALPYNIHTQLGVDIFVI
jgi:hypothetical protein